jgi:hypothetical protein
MHILGSCVAHARAHTPSCSVCQNADRSICSRCRCHRPPMCIARCGASGSAGRVAMWSRQCKPMHPGLAARELQAPKSGTAASLSAARRRRRASARSASSASAGRRAGSRCRSATCGRSWSAATRPCAKRCAGCPALKALTLMLACTVVLLNPLALTTRACGGVQVTCPHALASLGFFQYARWPWLTSFQHADCCAIVSHSLISCLHVFVCVQIGFFTLLCFREVFVYLTFHPSWSCTWRPEEAGGADACHDRRCARAALRQAAERYHTLRRLLVLAASHAVSPAHGASGAHALYHACQP